MREAWAVWRAQFGVLYRVFLLRVVDLELLSKDADPTRLVAQFATIFASVSFLFALPVLLFGGGRMSPESRWTLEHFFLELTMTVAGGLTVLHWDAAFPDRRDLLVLGPLPVGASAMFAAKIVALLAVPALAVLGLNVFSGVVWPPFFSVAGVGFAGVVRPWPAFWLTLLAGGAFMVCSVLTLQGLAANLLPRQIFLRLSAVLQAGALFVLLSVFLLEPSMEAVAALTAPGNQRWLACLPSYWFLGLFQQLNGSMQPAFVPLVRRAWVGLAAAALGAALSLLLAYLRLLPKTVEQPDLLPRKGGLRWPRRWSGSLAAAVTIFSLRSVARSRQHRILLSFYMGLGVAIVVVFAELSADDLRRVDGQVPVTWLLASVLMVLLPILVFRVLAAMPVSLPANWIFRVTQVQPARDYRRAVRVAWVTLGLVPPLLLSGAFLVATAAWEPVLWHALALLSLGVLVVELCVRSFRKIPCTCSYLPGKANLHFLFWAYLMLVLGGFRAAVQAESGVLGRPVPAIAMVVVLAGAAAGLRWQTERRDGDDELLFEEEYDAEIVSLKLN